MDLEILEENWNSSLNESTYIEEEQPHTAVQVIFTTFCVLSVLADVLLIFVVLHFRRLHNVVNILLIHWCVADAISYIFHPTLFGVFSKEFYIEISLFCYLIELYSFCQCASFMFLILIVINWYIASFWSKHKHKWETHQKMVVTGTWTTTAFSCLLVTGHCYSGYTFIGSYIAKGFFVLTITSVICAHIIKCLCVYVKKKNPSIDYGLMLVSIVAIIYLIIEVAEHIDLSFNYLLIVEALLVLRPITILCLLYFRENNFKIYLKKTLKFDFEDDNHNASELEENNICRKCGQDIHYSEET